MYGSRSFRRSGIPRRYHGACEGRPLMMRSLSMRRLLHFAAWVMIVCAASSCAPDSELPPGTGGSDSSGGKGGSAGSFGGGGTGGTGATSSDCADALDADKDGIADA